MADPISQLLVGRGNAQSLTAKGLVVNIRKPKYNFTATTLTKVLVNLWTKDDLIFIPERYRLRYTFILRVYCWTGARLGAFFTGGFRYGGEFPSRAVISRLTDFAGRCPGVTKGARSFPGDSSIGSTSGG